MAFPASFNDERTAECSLSIQNNTAGQLQLIWINWEGQEQLYNLLEPNSAVTQGTFDSHTWLLKNEDGQVLVQYTGPSATLAVNPQGAAISVNRAPQLAAGVDQN